MVAPVEISTHKIYPDEALKEEAVEEMKLFNPEYQKHKDLGLSTRNIPKYIYLHNERDGEILVPRHYELSDEVIRHGNIDGIIDKTVEGEDVEFDSKIELWDEQKPAVEALVNNENGILHAGCGKGKTVMMLEAIARLGKPTLVLVHKSFLLNQWKDRIEEFLGEEAGVIRQDRCEYKDKKISIGMLQSLVNDGKYPEELFERYGIVVTDEVHRISSRTWKQVIQKFPAKRRYGLTATMERTDGLEVIFKAHIGDVVYRIEGEDLEPEIYAVETGVTHSDVDINSHINQYTKKIHVPKLITTLTQQEHRNHQIKRNIKRAVTSDRQLLILSHRVDHLKELEEWATEELSEYSSMLYIGATKQEKRDMAKQYDMIFATMKLVKEGLDIPSLDTLFLLTPTGSSVTVQQAVGRILREYPDKKKPFVIDFVDEKIDIMGSLFGKRKKIYKKLGYGVKKV